VAQKQETAGVIIVDPNASRQANLTLAPYERRNPRFVPTYNPKNRAHLRRVQFPLSVHFWQSNASAGCCRLSPPTLDSRSAKKIAPKLEILCQKVEITIDLVTQRAIIGDEKNCCSRHFSSAAPFR